MGTAVERLEIWTAFVLLAIAVAVGAAATVASLREMPAMLGEPASGSEAFETESGVAAETTATEPGIAAETTAADAYRAARAAIRRGRLAAISSVMSTAGRVPGGGFGLAAALVAGAVAAPLTTVTLRALRVARRQRSALRLRLPGSTPRLATIGRMRAQRATQGRRTVVQLRGATAAPTQAGAMEAAMLPLVVPCSGVGALHEPRGDDRGAAEDDVATEIAAPSLQPYTAGAALQAVPDRNTMSAEDRALAATETALALLSHAGVESPVLAVDVTAESASVWLALQPEDEQRLDRACEVAATLQDGRRVRWRSPMMQVSFTARPNAAPATSAMPVPLLALGRGRVRFAPLAGWRHLGVYGAGAHAAAHHVVSTLLCQRRPEDLALTVVDRTGWGTLYRNTPHWIDAPGDGPATADMLVRALARGGQARVRPVLTVVVDPDSAALSAFATLLRRLSLLPTAGVHLVLVQRELNPVGRQLYLTLPALITAGGAGEPRLLPAVRRWPRNHRATVVVGRQRWTGRPFVADEVAVAALARRLAVFPRSSDPVLWEAAAAELRSAGDMRSAGS